MSLLVVAAALGVAELIQPYFGIENVDLVFLTAVFVFGESMDKWKLLSFVIIWIALVIFAVSAIREDRGRTLPVEDPTAA